MLNRTLRSSLLIADTSRRSWPDEKTGPWLERTSTRARPFLSRRHSDSSHSQRKRACFAPRALSSSFRSPGRKRGRVSSLPVLGDVRCFFSWAERSRSTVNESAFRRDALLRNRWAAPAGRPASPCIWRNWFKNRLLRCAIVVLRGRSSTPSLPCFGTCIPRSDRPAAAGPIGKTEHSPRTTVSQPV